LRFTVHRPGFPAASPRSHGVPRRDVPGRVHVSVAGEPAGSAPEDGLALARLPVHLPARRAPLARERRTDLFHPAGRLLLQAAHQQPPPRPQDAPVQPSLSTDTSARAVPGALRGPGHRPDPQVLHPDHVEPAGDIGAGFLGPVLTPVRLPGAQPGDGMPDPRPAVRSAPGTGQLPLQPPQANALAYGQAGDLQQLSCRQRGGDRHAPVDAHGLAVTRRGHRFGNGGEGHVPAAGPVLGHPVGLHAWRRRARPAEPHPPGLRHPHLAGMARHPAHLPLPAATSRDPESLIAPGLAPARLPGRVVRVKGRRHGLGEVPQRLLLDGLGAGGQPRMRCPRGGELPALVQVARRGLPARPPVGVLLNGQVPHVPGVGTVVPQYRLLGGRGVEPIPGHANTLAITADIRKEVKRRLSLSPKTRVSTPRS